MPETDPATPADRETPGIGHNSSGSAATYARVIRNENGRSIRSAITIGENLTEAKASKAIKHGRFGEWAYKLGHSRKKAAEYMRLASVFGSNVPTSSHITVSSLLLLASEDAEDVRDVVMSRLENGAIRAVEEVREAIRLAVEKERNHSSTDGTTGESQAPSREHSEAETLSEPSGEDTHPQVSVLPLENPQEVAFIDEAGEPMPLPSELEQAPTSEKVERAVASIAEQIDERKAMHVRKLLSQLDDGELRQVGGELLKVMRRE